MLHLAGGDGSLRRAGAAIGGNCVHAGMLLAAGASLIATSPSLAQIDTETCFFISPYRETALVRWDSETQLQGTVLDGFVADRPRRETGSDPRRGTAHGQPVLVRWAEGPGAERVAIGDTVVIVAWTLGEDCAWYPADALPASETPWHLELRLRPDTAWLGGRPTFDITPHEMWPMLGRSRVSRIPLEVYRDFVTQLPTEAEWEDNCRVAIDRAAAWVDEHPDVARHLPSVSFMRGPCMAVLERKAAERASASRSVPDSAPAGFPPALFEWIRAQGCRSQSGGVPAAPGRFSRSPGPQWAVQCVSPDSWRLVVVTLDATTRDVDLVKWLGSADEWEVAVAGSDYFDWTSAWEFTWRDPYPRPTDDVVLLRGPDGPTMAFYHSPEGWRQLTVRCCHWPEP
jgi:hypothetical protein